MNWIKSRKKKSIREEVETLVRRVVPEEIDNVDEMMLQYKGREEELVETLRSMQERLAACASNPSVSQTSITGGSSACSAASTTLSDSRSEIAKRDEIREEVENLVRRVVPEEIDNVDEMMLQFKGREEELVETLRTMQQRLED